MNFSIPATLASYTPTADKGIAIRFRSRQELGPEGFAKIHAAYQQEGVVIFAQGELSPEELETAKAQRDLRGVKGTKERTPSEELRAVLYRAWQEGIGKQTSNEDAEHYYRRRVLTFKALVLEELDGER